MTVFQSPIEVTVSQSDWHELGSVNRRLRNWRIKICGKKTESSWSTINSEHQVNPRSVNRRSKLI